MKWASFTHDIYTIPSAASLQITPACFWASYQVNTHLYACETLIKPQLLVFFLLSNDLVFTKTLTMVVRFGGARENFPLISSLAPTRCGHSLKVDRKRQSFEKENKASELR